MNKDKEMIYFCRYLWDYYGPQGLYPISPTVCTMHLHAAWMHALQFDGFCGDTIDRERARDYLVDQLGYQWGQA